MSASHYDVIVLGTDLAPLCCGALLAKRGFRVLVLGQGEPAPTYTVGAFTLPRRPFHFTLGASPVAKRVFPELGLGQSLRRLTRGSEPAFQVALPGHRFDVGADDAALAAEIEREFPELKRPIDDFHRDVERVRVALDAVFERDLVFPAGTFWERQRLSRQAQGLDARFRDDGSDLLAEFPEQHAFRAVAALPARFGGGIDPDQAGALRTLRLYSNAQRGALEFDGGAEALAELLAQKVRAHSGQVLADERAAELVLRHGQLAGVRLFGSGEEISGEFLVAGIDVSALLRLVPERAPFEALFERIGEPLLRHYRYTLNVVMRSGGLPSGLGRDVYLEHAREGELGPLRIRVQPLDHAHSLLCSETLLVSRKVEDEEGYVARLRPPMLAALRELLPFLDQHTVLVDSPHDGLPPEGVTETLDAFALARRGPRFMPAVYSYPVLSGLRLCGLPVRSPVRRLLFCNAQVVPGLGAEGQMLAASSAARVVSRADRGKAWMRRRLWTKVEI